MRRIPWWDAAERMEILEELMTVKANWQKLVHPLGGDWWSWGDTRAHVSLDDGLWHMSISCPNRSPTWEEIKMAWYDLVPEAEERTGAILLPKNTEYVNLHETCFHVYELAEEEVPKIIVEE